MTRMTSLLGLKKMPLFVVALSLVVFMGIEMSQAETGPITPSGLNTQVSGPITVGTQTQYNITDGTRPGGGTNLFHSFGDFGVPDSNIIANFLNNSGLSTSNIIARVTGLSGNNPIQSNISGTIQTTGFGNANLFLMNPAGFVFGPNATINVGGSANFVAGDYLRMADNALFYANSAQTSTLSVAAVTSFGFLAGNPMGTIRIEGGTVKNSSALTLVGRDKVGRTTITPGIEVTGTLSNVGGKVTLVSVGSPTNAGAGEVTVADQTSSGFGSLGTIALKPGAAIDTSTNTSVNNPMAAGAIVIRGNKLEMDGASLRAISRGYNFESPDLGQVDPAVDVTAGNIDITVNTFTMLNKSTMKTGSTGVPVVLANGIPIELGIGSGFADGIPIALTPGTIRLNVQGFYAQDSTISTASSLSYGRAGFVSIKGIGGSDAEASSVHLVKTSLFLSVGPDGPEGSLHRPSAGEVKIRAKDVTLDGLTYVAASPQGVGGDFVIHSSDTITIENSQLNSKSFFGASGTFLFEADKKIDLVSATISSSSDFEAPAGDISLTAPVINMTGGKISTDGQGIGAGNISFHVDTLTVQAFKNGTAVHHAVISSSYANALSIPGAPFGGGQVTVEGLSGPASSVSLDNSFMSTEIFDGSPGSAPTNITIAAQAVTLSNGGSITASTTGNAPAGNIRLITQQLTMTPDSAVTSNAKTGGSGKAGAITITGAGSAPTTITGGTVQAQSETIATAGNITLMAQGDLSLLGTTVSVKNTGIGDAGDIKLKAGNDLLVRNSQVSTESVEASGGDIKLTAPNIIRLVDSTLISSVQGQVGSDGGNIDVDPQLVVIQNSQLRANANAGAGGTITVVASGAVLVDPNSLLDPSAGPAGVSGSVNIDAPVQFLSGVLVPLNLAYSQAGLSGDRCAAGPTGQFSSFVQTGRDGVPQVPGALSPSPISFLETLTSGSLGLPGPSLAAARLGLDSVSLDGSTLFRFPSACRS